MTWARLCFRLQRSEIVFAALLSMGFVGAALWLAADMRSILATCGTPSAPEACDVIFAFQTSHGHVVQTIQMAMGFAGYAIPLVIGVPILTREIEQRTAMIAWPLAGSRTKWLAWRVVPALVISLVLVALLAFAAEELARAYLPHGDLGFANHGARGISMVTRAALVLVTAVAVGALLGRLLPALLVGIALAVGLSAGVGAAMPYGVASANMGEDDMTVFGAHPFMTGIELLAPDGTPISDVEAELLYQAVYEEHGPEPDPALLPRQVYFGIAGSRYSEVLLRESAVLVGASVLIGALAVVVVNRRRPE